MAQERGARTVADLVELAATRPRRVHAQAQPRVRRAERPGVYLFRDVHDQVLYVGQARDLRARLRSYFRSDRQRPAVEAALGALERIEWRETGSELEAALEELRLIRELRPPANARSVRPDRYVYLRRRGDSVVSARRRPDRSGPLREPPHAPQLAARALAGRRVGDARRRAARAADEAEAARARAALRGRGAPARPHRRRSSTSSRELERLRAAAAASRSCLVVRRRRRRRVVRREGAGRRRFDPGRGPSGLEWQAGLAAVARAEPTRRAGGGRRAARWSPVLRRPPPELRGRSALPFTDGGAPRARARRRLAQAGRRRRDRRAGRRCSRGAAVKLVDGAAHRDGAARRWPARLDALLADARNVHLHAPDGDVHARRTKKGRWLVSRGKPSSTVEPSPTRTTAQRSIRCPTTIRSSRRRTARATSGGRCSTTSSCCARCRCGSASAIRVVDAGCGKAYMSLALVAYGREVGTRVELVGLDANPQVIETVPASRTELGYDEARFEATTIDEYETRRSRSTCSSRCTRATRRPTRRSPPGVRLRAEAIVVAPCCHHELAAQIARNEKDGLLRHGLLLGRQADLVTDALRAAALETARLPRRRDRVRRGRAHRQERDAARRQRAPSATRAARAPARVRGDFATATASTRRSSGSSR